METASNCPSVVVTYGSGKHSIRPGGGGLCPKPVYSCGKLWLQHTYIQLAFTKTTEAEKDFLKDNFCNGIAISRWDYAKG